MSTTFLALQTNIATDLDDTGNARFPLAKVKRVINEGRRDLITRTKLLKKESSALPATATTPTYAWYTLPDDFLMLDETEQGGIYNSGRRIYPTDHGCLGDNWATVTGSQPTFYFKPTGGNPTAIRIWPYPGADAWAASHTYAVGAIVSNGGKLYTCITAGASAGSGGPGGTGTDIPDNVAHWSYVAPPVLTIWYAYQPDDLSGNSDPTLLPTELDVALEFYAKARLLEGGEDAEQGLAASYAQRYELKVREATAKAANGASNQATFVRYRHV